MTIVMPTFDSVKAQGGMTRDQATVKYVQMLVKSWNGEANHILLLNTSNIVSIMNELGVSAIQAELQFGIKIVRADIQHPMLAKIY